MARDDVFMQHLATKYGTGVASRADQQGGHMLSRQLVDSYSQAGQAVPQQLRGALKELNDLTDREVMLSKTTPSARAALGGAGYNALQVQRRVRELEDFLYAESADARNLGARLDLEHAEQRNRTITLTNDYTEAVMPARIEADIAGFAAQRADSLSQAAAIDASVTGRELLRAADENGVSTQEMQEVLRGGDPGQIKATFGTADRTIATAMYRQRVTNEAEELAVTQTSMATVAATDGAMLAMDDAYTDEDLSAMLNGERPLPDGITQMAVQVAMGQRAESAAAALQMRQLELANRTETDEYKKAAMSRVPPAALASQIIGALSGGADTAVISSMMEALNSGRAVDVYATLAELVRSSGSNGRIQITDPDGVTVEVPVQALLEHIADRSAADVALQSDRALNDTVSRSVMETMAETDRYIKRTEAFLGAPLPGGAKQLVDAAYAQSQALIQRAYAEPDAKKKMEYLAAAEEVQEQMRKTLGDALEAKFGNGYQVQDARAGRFASQESFANALVNAVGFSSSGPRTPGFNQTFGQLLDEKAVNTRDFQQWADKMRRGEATLEDIGITPREVYGVLDETAFIMLTNTMLDVMASDDNFQSLISPEDQEQLGALMIGDGPEYKDMSTSERLQRTLTTARLLDEKAAKLEAGRAAAEGRAPAYERGRLLQRMQDQLAQPGYVSAALTGGKGVPSREMLAFMGVALNAVNPQFALYGEGAPAAEDVPDLMAAQIMQRTAAIFAGNSMTNRAGLLTTVRRDSTKVAGASMLDYARMAYDRRMVLEGAVLGAAARRASNPEAYRDRLFGLGLPSLGMSETVLGSYTSTPRPPGAWLQSETELATREEIADELRRMGYDPAEYMGE